jgi:hypothetical protein
MLSQSRKYSEGDLWGLVLAVCFVEGMVVHDSLRGL